MAVKLNGKGRSHAKSLIADGKVDKDSSWSFSAEDGNKILGDPPDWADYAKWFLGEDTSAAEKTKDRYKYPFGKSGKVYRSGVIAAKQRAAQQGESEIADASGGLLESIDKEGKSAEAAKEEKEMDQETVRRIKVGKQYRSFQIEQRQIDEGKRTVGLSFSSEEPVERFWGVEILDHLAKSVNLRRLKRGGSLLIDHDMTKQVGVIEEVSIDETNRKGRATVRFGKRGLADDTFQDVLDGIKSNVSVGYQIDEVVLEKEVKDAASIYRVTRWEP